MKQHKPKDAEETAMTLPSYVAVLAILSEMARRVNENISKVDLKPLQRALNIRDSAASNS